MFAITTKLLLPRRVCSIADEDGLVRGDFSGRGLLDAEEGAKHASLSA